MAGIAVSPFVTLAEARAEGITLYIGGRKVGEPGAGGSIYEGFVLSGGDDFRTSLSVVSPLAPHGRYFDTRAYLLPADGQFPRSAGSGHLTLKGYDAGPTNTGAEDANRGRTVKSWQDMLRVENGRLRLKSRAASPYEHTLSGGKDILSSMIHTGGMMVARPPCIIEARLTFNANTLMNRAWHPCFWLQFMGPMNSSSNIEIDWEAMDSVPQTLAPNSFNWTDGSSKPIGTHNVPVAKGLMDGAAHDLGFILLEDRFHYVLDGSIVATKSFDLTSKGDRAAYMMLTNHVADFNRQFSLPAWKAGGNEGAEVVCDWWRMWRLGGTRHRQPKTFHPDVNVDFGQSLLASLPSASELWGDGAFKETFEAVVHDENGPGGNSSGGWTGLPRFIAFDGTTLKVGPSDKPGRLYFLRTATCRGETCEPARFCLNVGPRVDEGELRFAPGARTLDLYALCDVGDLLPKKIQVADLPRGVTFEQSTGLLVDGRDHREGAANVRIRLSNAIGQSTECIRVLSA
jgi:hypothetical protein